jgi:hypothetical protein
MQQESTTMYEGIHSKAIKLILKYFNIALLPLFIIFIHGMVPWTSIFTSIGTVISSFHHCQTTLTSIIYNSTNNGRIKLILVSTLSSRDVVIAKA